MDEPKDISKEPLVKSMWHELYIECQASPLDQRTDKEFCEENKLHIQTLMGWKRLHRKSLYDEVQRRRTQYINEMRSVAYKHLNSMCKKDVNAIKLLMQLTGDLVEKSQTLHEFAGNREEKIARINNLLKEANDKAKTWKKVQDSQGATDAVPPSPNVSDGKPGDGTGKDHA